MMTQTSFRRDPGDDEDDTTLQIVDWILAFVAKAKGKRARSPKSEHRFEDFGLDSMATIKLAVELSEWLSLEVDPVLAFEFPTVERLARHLAHEIHARG
jgi:acyl carrier protein